MKRKYSARDKKNLGLNSNITRKDFLKGSLLGSGMMLLNMPAPAYGQKILKRIEGEDWNGSGWALLFMESGQQNKCWN